MGQHQFEIAYVFEYVMKLLPSLKMTMIILVSSILIGLFIGLIVAIPQLYRIPLLRQLSRIYVSFFRGTPILLQLFLFYYGVPELLKLVGVDASKAPALLFVIVTYALHSGAYISEVIRGAVTAVDKGQVEAAYAVGMNSFQAFRRIVMPQALAVSIPIFANVVIGSLKDTSLAFTLGIMEISGKARTLGALSHRFVEIYLSLAIIYFIICFVLEKLFQLFEKRLLRHESATVTSINKQPFSKTLLHKWTTVTDARRKEAKQ